MGAVRAALRTAPGTVTSAAFEDGRFWQVEVTGAGGGRARELAVDAASGAVSDLPGRDGDDD